MTADDSRAAPDVAEALAWLRPFEPVADLSALLGESEKARRYAATIVRAALARVEGRDGSGQPGKTAGERAGLIGRDVPTSPAAPMRAALATTTSAEDDIRDADDEAVYGWLHEDSISHSDGETAALAARTLTLIQDRDTEIAKLRKSVEVRDRILDRAFGAIPDDVEAEDDDLSSYIRAALAAAPAGPVSESNRQTDIAGSGPPPAVPREPVEALLAALYEHRLVQIVWREVAEVRRHLDGPARDEQQDSIEVAARQLFKVICREHERGETFPVSVSVCMNALREALGETYPDDGPARDEPQDGGA